MIERTLLDMPAWSNFCGAPLPAIRLSGSGSDPRALTWSDVVRRSRSASMPAPISQARLVTKCPCQWSHLGDTPFSLRRVWLRSRLRESRCDPVDRVGNNEFGSANTFGAESMEHRPTPSVEHLYSGPYPPDQTSGWSWVIPIIDTLSTPELSPRNTQSILGMR